MVILIVEHLDAVEADPDRFGLKPEDLAPQNDEERRNRNVRRERVLTAVLKNGFCRVRFEGRRNVVEYYADTPEENSRKRTMIDGFLKQQNIKVCIINNLYTELEKS